MCKPSADSRFDRGKFGCKLQLSIPRHDGSCLNVTGIHSAKLQVTLSAKRTSDTYLHCVKSARYN